MRTIFSLTLMLLSLSFISAQEKRDYIWTIGDNNSNGLPHPDFGGVNINFNEEALELNRIERLEMSFFSNSSSISNLDGNILFYTDGCFIYNKLDTLIENGDRINVSELKDEACVTGSSYFSGNASTLFIPNPEYENEYYLIHQRVDEVGSTPSATLLFSIINSSANNGLGEASELNLPISEVRPLLGEMAAVKHANGNDWWVVVPEDSTNNYNLVLINEDSIQNTHDQKIGNEIGYDGMGTGQCKFSPDGTKFARWTSSQQLIFAEFDRETGTFTNEQQISVLNEGTRGGIEFSPNSRLFYVSTTDSIFQFDTDAIIIEDSKILVAEWDGFSDFLPTKFRRMQITPDCRIFVSLPGSHRFWHIIHNPNEKGIACNVEQRGLSLKTWTFNTMPYFPNYNLGAIGDTGGYPCDSTKITVSSADLPIFEPEGFVYPNPSVGTLHIDMPSTVGTLNFQLFDISGKQVFTKNNILSFEEIYFGEIANGLYFYKIFDKKGRSWSGKVVVNQ